MGVAVGLYLGFLFYSLLHPGIANATAAAGIGSSSSGGGSGVGPNAAACRATRVFSHRAAAPGMDSVLGPGSLASTAWLLERGVCAFDVDCFTTRDGELVVGHPTEVVITPPYSPPYSLVQIAAPRRAESPDLTADPWS